MRYPRWFTKLDRKRIEAALEQAAPSLESSPHGWIEGYVRVWYASDAAAVKAVIPVCRVIAHVLSDRSDQRPPEINVPVAARQLLDDVITTIYDWCSSSTTMTIDAFTQRVQDKLRKHPWWGEILRVRNTSSDSRTVTPRSSTTRGPALLSVPQFVKELKAADLQRSCATVYRWINEGKVRVNKRTGQLLIPRTELEEILSDDQFLSDRDR